MKKNLAFTLVELAIVIVIAGLLAAVAIPIYNGVVDDAKWSEAKQGASAIKNALVVYGRYKNGFSTISSASWTAVKPVAETIGIQPTSLEKLQYFSDNCFQYQTLNSDQDFEVRCASDYDGVTNTSPKKPSPGYGAFSSATNLWTGNFAP